MKTGCFFILQNKSKKVAKLVFLTIFVFNKQIWESWQRKATIQ